MGVLRQPFATGPASSAATPLLTLLVPLAGPGEDKMRAERPVAGDNSPRKFLYIMGWDN